MQPNIDILPNKPGVYIMRSSLGEVLYVGKAKNINKRVRQYFQDSLIDSRGWMLPNLLPLIAKIDYIVAASEADAFVLEARLIKKFMPFFNSAGKDDKSYPYLKITQEDFPRAFLTRSKKGPGSYYGPYPSSHAIKSLMRYLWKSGYANLRPCKWNFNLQKPLAERKINTCIYYHTAQCTAPCAGKISKEDYNKIVQRYQLFAQGKYNQIERDLEVMMRQCATNMEYEKAAEYRNFLRAIEQMKQRIVVGEFKDEKIFLAITATQRVKRLGEVLGLKKAPGHIETFDTSGLYGRYAVGSMVCYIDGKKHHAHFRRFKIKSALPGTGNDDFLMMEEIVRRRLLGIKRAGGEMPDLMLIDGGKGQLSAAQKAAKAAGVKMRFIALAEREEEIFIEGQSESIKLDQADPARLLLMEMRDEVHRFAITYHRKLRDEDLLKD